MCGVILIEQLIELIVGYVTGTVHIHRIEPGKVNIGLKNARKHGEPLPTIGKYLWNRVVIAAMQVLCTRPLAETADRKGGAAVHYIETTYSIGINLLKSGTMRGTHRIIAAHKFLSASQI